MKITLEDTNDLEIKAIQVIPENAKCIVFKSTAVLQDSDMKNIEEKMSEKFGIKCLIIGTRMSIEAIMTK